MRIVLRKSVRPLHLAKRVTAPRAGWLRPERISALFDGERDWSDPPRYPEPRLPPRAARILVVEDEVLIRIPIAEELQLKGFSVIEADSADDALTRIRAGEQVDLVFSDIQTPSSLNGVQFAETLRDNYPDIPVILTSGNALPKQHVGIVAAFVPKPYDVMQTIALISAMLAQKARDHLAGLAFEV